MTVGADFILDAFLVTGVVLIIAPTGMFLLTNHKIYDNTLRDLISFAMVGIVFVVASMIARTIWTQ